MKTSELKHNAKQTDKLLNGFGASLLSDVLRVRCDWLKPDSPHPISSKYHKVPPLQQLNLSVTEANRGNAVQSAERGRGQFLRHTVLEYLQLSYQNVPD